MTFDCVNCGSEVTTRVPDATCTCGAEHTLDGEYIPERVYRAPDYQDALIDMTSRYVHLLHDQGIVPEFFRAQTAEGFDASIRAKINDALFCAYNDRQRRVKRQKDAP